jgi:hypothetical protein
MENIIQEFKEQKSLRIIRNVYLYLVSMIGLMVLIVGTVGIINNILQNYLFRVNYNVYNEAAIYPYKSGPCYVAYPDPSDKEGKKLITPTAEEIADCKKAQKEQQEQDNRNRVGEVFSIAIAQIVVGLPVWLFHWSIIQNEYKKREEKDKQ